MSETDDEIVITDEMAAAGIDTACDLSVGLSRLSSSSASAIYRAMAKLDPARQSSFTPTDDDVLSLATALYANALDVTFATAKARLTPGTTKERDYWHKAARIAFDHPGYLPSIKAARQDAMSAYKYESDKYREEIAAWKNQCAVLHDQLHSALSEVRPVKHGICTLHGSIFVMGKCPLCADDVKFKAELKLADPEHLTLDQQYRLVEVAFITDNQQIRRAALDVLMRAFNPGIVMP